MQVKKFGYTDKPLINTLVLLLLALIIKALSLKTGFFWDNVTFGTKMGNILFQNGVFNWNIPDAFDPGHPAFLASILSSGWKIFGRTLLASHLMMLPFVFGLLFQLQHLVAFFIKNNTWKVLSFILLLADPTLLSNLVLINPEIIQLFFFFLALNGALRGKSAYRILGLGFMGIVTYRGMMLCAGLFLAEIAIHLIHKKQFLKFFSKKLIIEYLLGALPALIFVIWRLTTKGWLQSNPDSPWTESWQWVSIHGLIRNIAILATRMLDFGHVFIWLGIGIILLKKRTLIKNKQFSSLFWVGILSTIVIIVTMLTVTNSSGHRYFLSTYLCVSLAFMVLIEKHRLRNWFFSAALLGFISAHFWIYPDKYAQGWAATLAHLPYWNLRTEMVDYMDDNEIPIDKTASFFPNQNTIDNIVVNNDMRGFTPFTGKEMYVFYSNVYNPSDEEFDLLEKNYSAQKEIKKNRVKVILYTLKKDN